MKKRLANFLKNDFGLGGVANYTQEQSAAVVQLLTIFYGENFSDAERDSVVKFLAKNEKNDNDYRERIEALQDEADNLKDAWGI